MKADPSAQLALLDLQQLDSATDQLRHQRSTLPELAEIQGLTATLRSLGDAAADGRIVVDDLTAEQAKADADVEQVKTRRERDRTRIDQGLITNPKDLERMQQEMVSLERRITSLEDTELEIMERLETAQQALDSVSGQLGAAEARLADLTSAKDTKTADLDGSLAATSAQRDAAAADIPADLLALYERIRSTKGVGAAALRARQCGGCQLTLTAADLARIRAASDDEVLRCEECARILVRTAESGL